jgi:DNA polymerase III delta prime subunit
MRFPDLHQRSESWRTAVFGLNPTHPEVAKLALTLEGFLRRALHNDRTCGTQLLIAGNPGTGKSHACQRLAQQFQAWAIDALCEGKWGTSRVPSVEFREWSAICDHPGFDEIIGDLKRASLIILDDVGSELDRFRNGATTEKLRRTLEAVKNHWVLATTNLSDQALTKAYDARVTSRFDAFARIEVFNAPDFRKAIGSRSNFAASPNAKPHI